MTRFRPVPDVDRTRYREILRYAFAPQQGPLADEVSGEWPPAPELFDPRALYDGGELLSTCKLYYLDAWFRTGYERIGGLGAVATPPEHRREGHVRDLCRGALAEFEEEGAGLVALWPFETAFYAKLGWATANKVASYECPPSALPGYDASGRVRPLGVDDWERLRQAEAESGAGVALSLRRTEEWWRERTLTDWLGRTDPYIYGYECDSEIEGYLTYTVADDDSETLTVETLASADEEAYRALLSFLGTHGAQVEKLAFTRPEGSELLDRAGEPERVDCEIRPGPMVRLTTPTALELYSWPAGELECTLAVVDPLVAGGAGVYRLAIEDGEATVRDAAIEPGEADLELDVGTLSQLAVGSYGVGKARRLDRLTVRNESVVDGLSSVFEPQQVYLGEFF